VQENSLSLVYQPKFDLNSQQISGLEALLRWHDSELGAISPAEFIPIAEKHKLMSAIGSWVITEVCRQIRSWQRDCPSFDLRVAINISVQQIDGTDFYNQIMVLLFREKVSPSQLELEVTESVLISDPDRIMTLFSQLRRAGFHISIDDFGTGYSSMSYLTRLQANILKIDRSFVTNITSKGHGRTVVKAIIDLGHSLGLKIIAEGVETDAQLRILQQLGCDVGQGYLFCRPITASELLAQTIKTDSKEQLLD
jgi:EAL domain-containing protein (putative c-di-GMP-specific phosphodiesterase class I)